MLELQNLTVGFDGESILKNINMIFKPGEVTVITGPVSYTHLTLPTTERV